MTRDEAIKTWRDMLHPENGPRWSSEEWSKKAIDCYVALGMLKLDEPKTVPDCGGSIGKIRLFMRNFHLKDFTPAQLMGALVRRYRSGDP